jgi:MerR family transcriptional regulator, light-induced transcriptional regulator
LGLFSRLATRPVYNTQAVVQRTGVPADTFRAWERRYGLPNPARTDGNQRRYSDRDVAMIAWLRDQTRSGLTISQAVELFRSREDRDDDLVEEFPSPDAERSAQVLDEHTGLSRYTRELVEALVAYDSRTASHVLEEALAIVPVEDVCLDVLQPALYEIGARWQRGEILISGEHFATSFAIRKLGSLFNLSRPEHGRGPVVASCLEGELHEVGLLMTCLFLSRRGFRVIYLGPNLPVSDLIETVLDIRPPLVLLSASTPDGALDVGRASHDIKQAVALADSNAKPPEIGYGGKVFLDMPFLRDGVDGVFCGRNAEEAVAVIDAFISRADPRSDPA